MIAKKEEQIEIYAELSRKQYKLIQDGKATIEVPSGVEMTNKVGSRGLLFTCTGVIMGKALKEGLDNSYISWQSNL